MKTSLILAAATVIALGSASGAALAHDGHWRPGHGNPHVWRDHYRGPPSVVFVQPPAYAYGYGYAYLPPPVVYVPPPPGINIVLPIHVR
jgi:hypothetical protein